MVKKKLIIHVQHGLGNRLRAMASAMAIAKQSNRELIIIWEPDKHCECYFHELFEYDGVVLTSTQSIDFKNADCYTYMEIEPDSCKDQYIELSEKRDVYVRSAYVINNELSTWDKENIELQALKPVDEISRLITTVQPAEFGIHIRMEGAFGTDEKNYEDATNWSAESHQLIQQWRSKSHYSRFIKRVEEILEEAPETSFFLAADSPVAYDAFSQYRNNVSFLKRSSYDRSLEQLRYAVADAILLSKCKIMLGSTWSSFSELAQRFSKTLCKIELSGRDF